MSDNGHNSGNHHGNHFRRDITTDYGTGQSTDYGTSSASPPSRKPPFSRTQRLTIIYGILCFVILLVMLQLWLLMATMNAYLGGDDSVVWPALIASLFCFGLNVGLVWYLYALERP